MTTAAPTPATAPTVPTANIELVGPQTCDICGPKIRARWAVWLRADGQLKPLTFCNHHLSESREKLEALAVDIMDLSA